ncbi:MAG: ATP-binding protein [Paracoccaceae bacterium]|nr:ATP-binding protein [Paracoccaceae bacterium]MDG2260149.1 ATP-binding protein [Paracoccaceae bacterium]
MASLRGDQGDRSSTQVVMAEVLNNIVEHGKLGPEQRIRSSVSVLPDGIECSVIDEAPVYRALVEPADSSSLTCEASIQLAEGGYGVFLIQSLAKDIRYIEVEQGNHLEFRIPLTTVSEQIC